MKCEAEGRKFFPSPLVGEDRERGSMARQERSIRSLVAKAREASRRAYAPYSKYKVGAALLSASGKIFIGCNVENRSYAATVCAERAALCQAVGKGEKNFKVLVISSAGHRQPLPCGLCLQSLSEFARDLQVVVEHKNKLEIFSLTDIYPKPF